MFLNPLMLCVKPEILPDLVFTGDLEASIGAVASGVGTAALVIFAGRGVLQLGGFVGEVESGDAAVGITWDGAALVSGAGTIGVGACGITRSWGCEVTG